MERKSIDTNVNDRKFKKSGKDSFRISSLHRQSGTHVVSATLRILLATAPRTARPTLSSFLNVYFNRKFKKSGKDSFRISSLHRQSGTHVVAAILRILLATAPRTARLSLSSFLNVYFNGKFKKSGKDSFCISSLHR